MLVSYEKAQEVFENFDNSLKAPSINPDYLIIDAERDPLLKPCFFIYREQGESFLHGFHIAPVPGTEFRDIQSPYGYGGPIATCSDPSFLDRAWQSYLLWCEENKILVEFIRFHPLVKNWKYYKGEIFNDRQTVWIDLHNTDLYSSYSGRARTAIKKAVKNGLNVEWGRGNSMQPVFTALYSQAMQNLQADNLYFFSDSYFRSIIKWNRAHTAICSYGEQVVAASIFLVQEDIMEYHLSATSPLGKKYCGANLLLHEAASFGRQNGCRSLHLGGGTDSRPDNPLLFFKLSFSQKQAAFKIGKFIHNQAAYNMLAEEWQAMNRGNNQRILFYR